MKQERTHRVDPRIVDAPMAEFHGATEQAPQKEKEKRPLHFLLVNHSHLDYAWYRPRAESKVREAELVDGIIDALDAGEIDQFTIEQTVAGREYRRDLRRDRKDDYERMCQDGKFELIGTEIQQEVFLAGEEVFFWNVEVGHDEVEQQGGKVSRALYIPDTFGFPESMPKMARAAGYDNLIYMRGMGDQAKILGAVFNWESDDGSSILAVPMVDGYGSASKLGRWTVENGKHVPLHNQPDQWESAAHGMVNKILGKYEDRFTAIDPPHVLLGAGSDFEDIDLELPRIVAYVEEQLQEERPGTSFTFGSYEDYLDLVDESIDKADLNTFTGEMRAAAEQPVLRGIDSARMPLKQAAERAECQIHNADALLALSILRAKHDPDTTYHHSTQLLQQTMYEAKTVALPAYSHDAISGCGTDDVPDDMLNRLRDAWGFADQTKRNSLFNLAGRKDNYAIRMELTPDVSVINTQPHDRRDIAVIPLQKIYPNADHLTADINGEAIPVQVIKRDGKRYALASVDVQGFGASKIHLTEADGPEGTDQKEKAEKTRSIENEFYKLDVLPNGVIQVQDKVTGEISHAHMFEDQADAGDEYNFNPLNGEEPVTTERNKAKVSLLTEGPVVSELQIDIDMQLPAELSEDRAGRSEELVSNKISTVVRLTQGVDRIDFTTTLDNNAKDHRLRVLFKTPNGEDTVKAKEAYGMTERSGVPIPGGETWREPLPVATSHNQGLIVAGDLALFNKGLPEYEAFENDDGTIDEVALTLVRSVGWLSRNDLQTRKGVAGPITDLVTAQCQGRHTYEYSMSLRGKEDNAELIRKMNDFRFGLEPAPAGVNLDDVLQVEGEGFVVSALKPLRDGSGAMLRLYNPNATESTYNLEGMFATAKRVDAVFGKPVDDEDAKSMTLRPGEILTLALQ